MHFFIDHLQLPVQASSDAYGPVGNTLPDVTSKYDPSANFQLTSQAKAFACQAGAILVTPYEDVTTSTINNDLVNVILKPSKGLDIAFPAVKYYIYRGIRKDSFFNGAALNAAGSGNTETIKKIWEDHARILLVQPSTAAPEPTDLGFDLALDPNKHVEEIFNNGVTPLRSRDVEEGEWIGTFDDSVKIAFEVIVEPELLDVSIAYVKKSMQRINVSGLAGFINPTPSAAEAHELRNAREVILAYLDPAALFGMHYKIGVKVSTYSGTTKSTSKKKKSDIISTFLDKFETAERVYLDIRSEKGYSFNYYGNYGDANKKLLKLRNETAVITNEDPYYTMEWPLFFDSNAAGTKDLSAIQMHIRIDDNTKPLLYVSNPKVLGKRNKKYFKDDKALLNGTATDWSNCFQFFVQMTGPSGSKVNVATCIRMQYFRQQLLPVPTNSRLLEFKHPLDTIFGGIDINGINSTAVFQQVRNEKTGLAAGKGFAYVPETGIYFDATLAVMYADSQRAYIERKKTYPKLKIDKYYQPNIVASPVFPKEILFNKWTFEETATNFVSMIELVAFKKRSKAKRVDAIYFLGLTRVELEILQLLSGFDQGHQRFVVFEEIPNTEDVTGFPFKKFKLGVQGIDGDGNQIVVSPSSDMFVYGTGANIYCSAAFSATVSLPNLLPDPGLMQQWTDYSYFDYDETSAIVTGIFPDGIVSVQDVGNQHGFENPYIEVKGRCYYPVKPGETDLDDSKAPYPLVVIVHGNGHDYFDYYTYTDLCQHLAQNGFIVASIELMYIPKVVKLTAISNPPYDYKFQSGTDDFLYDSGTKVVAKVVGGTATALSWVEGTNFVVYNGSPKTIELLPRIKRHGMSSDGRANALFEHLRIIKAKFGSDVANKIGLIGHSRGGEGVVRASNIISGSNAPSFLDSIKAIVSLAPTDMYQKEDLTHNIPYYVLYGSRDGDISGFSEVKRWHLRPSDPDELTGTGGFTLYDRANNSTSKAMSFVYGATHNGFIKDNHDNPSLATVSLTAQRNTALAYMNAFFRMHLKSEPIWRPYMAGEHVPGSIGYTEIYQQFADMGSSTETIDDSQNMDADWTEGSAGKPISFTGTTIPVEGYIAPRIDTTSIDPYAPHETMGLKVKWDAGNELTYIVSNTGINISSLKYLSFRIGQFVTDFSKIDDMVVYLYDTALQNHPAKMTRNVPDPDPRTDDPLLTKSAMMTIRIPLIEYQANGVDLTNVKKIVLKFPSSGTGTVLIDDIAFTN
jgi:dienelactone hydrolase